MESFLASLPVAVLPLAMLTPAGSEVGTEFTIKQRIEVRIRFTIDVAAVTTIATIRAATRNVLFTPEAHASVSACASLHPDLDVINKH